MHFTLSQGKFFINFVFQSKVLRFKFPCLTIKEKYKQKSDPHHEKKQRSHKLRKRICKRLTPTGLLCKTNKDVFKLNSDKKTKPE